MASCDWQKIKTAGEAKAILRHSAEDTRQEDNHGNKDIDKRRTPYNMSMGAMTSYREACEAYDSHIADLDSRKGANKRKDRVTMIGLVIPAPAGMDDSTAMQWLSDAYDIVCDEMGEDNMIGGSIQCDERHEYVDARTGQTVMSRQHLHAYAIPEVDDKLNARKVMTRANMVRLNNRIEAMSQGRYGVPWLTGEGRKSTETVEALKVKSARAMIAQAEQRSAQIIEAARDRAGQIIDQATDRVMQAEALQQTARQTLSEAADRLETVKGREEAVRGRETALRGREDALRKAEVGIGARQARLRRDQRMLDDRETRVKEREDKVKERETQVSDLTKLIERGEATVGDLRQGAKDIRAGILSRLAATAQARQGDHAAQELADALDRLDQDHNSRGMSL